MKKNTKQTLPCSAVILSGGLNSRMGGNNKAFLNIGGTLIIDRILNTLEQIFSDIILVTRQPKLYEKWNIRVVEDLFDVRSSLTGIHAGLVNASQEHAFFVACDTPFLKKELVKTLLNHLEPDLDIIVPVIEDHYEPLCAIYSKQCIPFIEEQLQTDKLKIINLFDNVKVKTLEKEILTKHDPELISFFNVNTPQALEKSRSLNKE
ncbi:Molbdopterin-guanine dinucleotide biosynthesis protein A [Desulfonema limicola]|uniref:Probable molybdenum cofactor guanylyltransferase n=1 Tax=Desulfonema limicola TaxID=45656 RepID=A0A975GGY2_9BACT|nr:molybdenum cofactor guanylyltransferase [Desulfonema limicola]QTA80714.1 Molbdopterin-guanine dinucleotide biosynthesis protein A [Desulfonema limicola]